MKMTNQDILNFASVKLGDKHLPIKISYAISKNAEMIAPAVKAYDETRKNRLETYAMKDENGKAIIEDNSYKIDDVEKWAEDIAELNAMETEIDIHKVKLSEFDKCDDPKFDALSVSEMAILKFMIEE